MSELAYEKISASRCDGELVYTIDEQQLYKKKSIYKSQGYWYRCRFRKSCPAKVWIDFRSEKCVKKKNIKHDHFETQKTVYDEIKLISKIRFECGEVSELSSNRARVSDVFHRNVQESVFFFRLLTSYFFQSVIFSLFFHVVVPDNKT